VSDGIRLFDPVREMMSCKLCLAITTVHSTPDFWSQA